MTYKVKLEVFEGPLDLLLYLIKKEEINIYDIPIAHITEQYLAYLEFMQMLDLNIAGEFLVMAATLMHIKSRTLLPAQEQETLEEEEEDPRAELVRKLVEYKKFKEAASWLEGAEGERRKIFTRYVNREVSGVDDKFFEASLFDLISAFSKAVKDIPRKAFQEIIKDEFTIEDKIHQILHLLVVEPTIYLTKLFRQARDKMEIIVTFLAILELIRLKEVLAVQTELFGDIEIVGNSANVQPGTAREY